MVDWSKFKPEVFGSLPVAVLCLMLVMFSISFPYWITSGEAVLQQPGDTAAPSSATTVVFGLFEGRKTRNRGAACTRTIQWVCGSGVCMLSCGVTRADRRRDLELVLGNQSVSAVAGDSALCPPCKQADTVDTGHGGDIQNESEEFDPKPHMVRQGMLVTVIVLLLAGLLFTFTNIIFTVLNIAHNPVSSLMGVDGLVVWNLAAGLLYLLVVILWGAEYSLKMRTNLGLSDTLRPGPGTVTASHSKLGWCCLLLLCPMLLHLGLAAMFAWRQYNRYYNKRSKQDREMRINVQDPSQGGTDILF